MSSDTTRTKTVYWQGPGWYVELITDLGGGQEQVDYRFLAGLETRIESLQEQIKSYERPPHYFQPRVKRWRAAPAASESLTIHDSQPPTD